MEAGKLLNLSLFLLGYTSNSKWLLFDEESESSTKLVKECMSIYEQTSWESEFTKNLSMLLKNKGIEWKDFFNYCKNIFMAIEGMYTPVYRFLLEAHLKDEKYKDINYDIEDYHTNTLMSFSPNYEGIVCKVDIGAFVYGRCEDHGIVYQKRCGGYGPFSGDDGGGYHIGRKAVESIFMGFDGREEKDKVLKNRVLEHLYISRLRTLIHHLRGLGRRELPFEFFGLSKPVIEVNEEGQSSIARKILNSSAQQIMQSINVVLKEIKPKKRIPIYFYGDVYERSTYLQTILRNFVKNSPLLLAYKPAFCPLLGMVYRFLIKKRSYDQSKSRSIIHRICDGSPEKSCNKTYCFIKAV